MDTFLKYLDEKRAKRLKQIQRLQADLAEIDKAERLYRASGATGAAPPKSEGLLFEVPEPSGVVELPHGNALKGTIKDRVLTILGKNPDGLTSSQILNVLQISGLPSLMRESLSPQLSRLKGEEKIVLNHGLWSIPKHESRGA